MNGSVHLPARGVIEVTGEDRLTFLQGMLSNDVAEAAPGRSVWAALLTPQGKWLDDFFLFADGERLLLDCERDRAAEIVARLSRYRLRAKVSLLQINLAVIASQTPLSGIAAPDPRHKEAGWRALVADPGEADRSFSDWDRHRISLGLPDGSRDLEREKTILLEAGFDELHGISWSKGCYMGQELTARTKYRGLVKRRLVPVRISGPLPDFDTPILRDGLEVGAMRSGLTVSADEAVGLAQLRLEALSQDRLACGGSVLQPMVPRWMQLPSGTAV